MIVDDVFEIAGKGTVLVVVPAVAALAVGDPIEVTDPVTGQCVTGVVSGVELHVHRNCFGRKHPDAGAILTTLSGSTTKGAVIKKGTRP